MKLHSYYNNSNCKILNYSNSYKIEQLEKYKRTSAIFQFSSTILHKNIPLPIEQSKHLLAQLKKPVAWGYQTKHFYVLWSHWNLIIFLGTIRGLAYMITLVDNTLEKVKNSTILIHQFSLTVDEKWGIGIGLSFMLHELFFWQSKIFSQLTFQKDMLHVPYHYKLLTIFGIT